MVILNRIGWVWIDGWQFSPPIVEAVQVAVDIARFTSKDEFSGLPLADDQAWDYPSLDLYHSWGIKAEEAVELAQKLDHRGLVLWPEGIESCEEADELVKAVTG